MTDAETAYPARPLAAEEWLTLWRTVYFDMPLALAGEFDRFADGEAPRSAPLCEAAGSGAIDARASGGRSPTGDQVGALSLGCGDFAPEALDEIQGCFA